MGFFAAGIAMGLLVSIPPGPNSALCLNLASGGVRRAVPLITGAALADAAYSFLAATGLLAAMGLDAQLLSYLAPAFMLGAAIVAWNPELLGARATGMVPLLNPATIAIWAGLSSLPAAHALSLGEALLRPFPVALGTAIWFAALAWASARVSFRMSPGAALVMQRSVACLLGLAGIAGLAAVAS